MENFYDEVENDFILNDKINTILNCTCLNYVDKKLLVNCVTSKVDPDFDLRLYVEAINKNKTYEDYNSFFIDLSSDINLKNINRLINYYVHINVCMNSIQSEILYDIFNDDIEKNNFILSKLSQIRDIKMFTGKKKVRK